MTDLRPSPDLPPPFAGVEVWIFDLDNTLYPAGCNLFAQVDRRIGDYVAACFGIAYDDARRLQKRLFREHGTTLRGLMIEHGVDPEPFLAFVHDIDITPVPPDPHLDAALGTLPGRKLVYTNGSSRHAEAVLGRLGIARHFEAIHDIAGAGWLPKPDPRAYAELVRRHRIAPARACMIEDIARNLVPASALGMTTVWLRSDPDWARPSLGVDAIDLVIDDLTRWLLTLVGGDREGKSP
ncbi:MAG: pyrimidine 5'-nucleotidase [Azospirillum sp.]|nr:pyrimidine 5'-nucleotidase [Azospirillum sp.]